jgi:hypothetical protein
MNTIKMEDTLYEICQTICKSRGIEDITHEGVWGSGCIDPHFLDLGTSWR